MKNIMKSMSMAALVIAGAIIAGCAKQVAPEQTGNADKVATTISLGWDGTRAVDASGVKTFKEGDIFAIVYKDNSGNTRLQYSNELNASNIHMGGKQAIIYIWFEYTPAEKADVRIIYPSSMVKYDVSADANVHSDEATVDYSNMYDGQSGKIDDIDHYDLAVWDGKFADDGNIHSALLQNKMAILAIQLYDGDGDSITNSVNSLTIWDGTYTYTLQSCEFAYGCKYVAIHPTSNADIYYEAHTTSGDESDYCYVKVVSGKTYEAGSMYTMELNMSQGGAV